MAALTAALWKLGVIISPYGGGLPTGGSVASLKVTECGSNFINLNDSIRASFEQIAQLLRGNKITVELSA